jgi:hypothetical protein
MGSGRIDRLDVFRSGVGVRIWQISAGANFQFPIRSGKH